MKGEADYWRERYLLQKRAVDRIREELGVRDGESILDAIDRLKRRSETEEIEAVS